MPQRRKSIYSLLYTSVLIVVLSFFAHNCFQNVYYDVLSIHQDIVIFGYSYTVQDIFPYYDAKEGESLDIQNYTYKVSIKLICFVLSLTVYRLLTTLNIFLKELPGRKFTKMPYFILVLVGLFFYEFLDFIFFAGQTNWKYQAIAVASALIGVRVLVK